MTTIYAKHDPYLDGHLARVVDEMEHSGPPTIRCVRWKDGWYALEGSHRLAAAYQLGLPVLVVEMEPDAGEGLGSFWDRVAPGLRGFNFHDAKRLRLDAFIFPA